MSTHVVCVHPGWTRPSGVRPPGTRGALPKGDHVGMAALVPPPPIPDGDPLAGLTPNQQAIAVLVAEGRSHAEVAELLELSPGTIKNTMARVYAKLELAAEAHVAAKRLAWLVGYWAGKNERRQG